MSNPTAGQDVRFEVLPFGTVEQQAAELPHPVRLTVTCSPKHGPDHSLDLAVRLRSLGHAVTLHVAARMVRDADHLDRLLARMGEAGIDEAFVIGGDAAEVAGPYASAAELLRAVDAHPSRPARVGIGAYPEGHPLIEPGALEGALLEKAPLADYVATQLCFDGKTLERWLSHQRARGLKLPLMIGMPGQASPAKLLEISLKIGVGPSVSYLRKQRGIRNLLGLGVKDAPTELLAHAERLAADADNDIGGLHYFTFNQLAATYRWHAERVAAPPREMSPR